VRTLARLTRGLNTVSAEARLRRTVERHGIDVTLVQSGVEYDIKILGRSYEGNVTETVNGMPQQRERYLIPAYQVPGLSVQPYDVIKFPDRNRTIRKADPGYHSGQVVRWDVEVEG
jgi:hypothetical protein